jgi:hypothetical protein
MYPRRSITCSQPQSAPPIAPTCPAIGNNAEAPAVAAATEKHKGRCKHVITPADPSVAASPAFGCGLTPLVLPPRVWTKTMGATPSKMEGKAYQGSKMSTHRICHPSVHDLPPHRPVLTVSQCLCSAMCQKGMRNPLILCFFVKLGFNA